MQRHVVVCAYFVSSPGKASCSPKTPPLLLTTETLKNNTEKVNGRINKFANGGVKVDLVNGSSTNGARYSQVHN